MRAVLFVFCCWMAVLVCSCSHEFPLPTASGTADSSLATAKPLSKPAWPICVQPVTLFVPWLPQVPPGTWEGTKNCGQACSVMLAAYYYGGSCGSQQIRDANRWLAGRLGDSRYLDASGNGWYTGFTGSNALGLLIGERYRLQYRVGYGSGVSAIRSELNSGHPVVLGVQISNGNLVASGGMSHWVIAVAYDYAGNVYLNDPGTDRGCQRGWMIRYTWAELDRSWQTQRRIFAPVWR